MVSKPRITRLMGNVKPRYSEPAATRLIRIASVAKATDEIASEERIASALNLLKRSPSASIVAIGIPIKARLSQ